MAAILTLRSIKESPLTNDEVDGNFTNLNSEINSLESGLSLAEESILNLQELTSSDFSLTIDGDATGVATISGLSDTILTLDISSIAGNLSVNGDVDAVNFNSTSDAALKENLNIIESPLDKISKLNGYTFNWKENKQEAVGILAQEVEKVFPQIVHTGQDGVKRVSYDSLIPVMLEAIKELAKK